MNNKNISKYLPDALINIGIWIFLYYVLRPPAEHTWGLPKLPKLSGTKFDYFTEEKMAGIIILTIGLNIAIRRYVAYKSKNANERKLL